MIVRACDLGLTRPRDAGRHWTPNRALLERLEKLRLKPPAQ